MSDILLTKYEFLMPINNELIKTYKIVLSIRVLRYSTVWGYYAVFIFMCILIKRFKSMV
mgnify:CR=1 FL=1